MPKENPGFVFKLFCSAPIVGRKSQSAPLSPESLSLREQKNFHTKSYDVLVAGKLKLRFKHLGLNANHTAKGGFQS